MMNVHQARVVDLVLTNHVRGYSNAEHIGHILFPRVPVTERGGNVIEFGYEAFYRYSARRAPGAESLSPFRVRSGPCRGRAIR